MRSRRQNTDFNSFAKDLGGGKMVVDTLPKIVGKDYHEFLFGFYELHVLVF